MPTLLAIEPNREEASVLGGLVDDRVHGTLTLTSSVDAAIAAIDRQVPEVILISPLMAPKDEARLVARLRALPKSAFVQTLITPMLAAPAEPDKRSIFSFRSRPKSIGCEPSVFADQLKTYLDLAETLKTDVGPGNGEAAAERRSTTRIVGAECSTVSIDGWPADLVNLSATGAQVLSQAVLVPGRLVPVVFESSLDAIRCLGVVVWGEFELSSATHVPMYRAGVELRLVDGRLIDRLRLPIPVAATSREPVRTTSFIRPRFKLAQPRAPRYVGAEVDWLSTIRSPSGHEMCVLNISRSGVLVETASKFDPGTMCELQLACGETTVAVRARFIRSEVASVDRRGVRYHAAAAFEKELAQLRS